MLHSADRGTRGRGGQDREKRTEWGAARLARDDDGAVEGAGRPALGLPATNCSCTKAGEGVYGVLGSGRFSATCRARGAS